LDRRDNARTYDVDFYRDSVHFALSRSRDADIYGTDITRRVVIIQAAKDIDIAPFVEQRGNSSLFISRAARARQVRSIELHPREMETSGIKASPARKYLFGAKERQNGRDALAGMPG